MIQSMTHLPGLTTLSKLFNDNSRSWQGHLGAAVNMYEQGHKRDLPHFGAGDKSRSLIYEDIALSEHEAAPREQIVAFRFMEATTLWLDVISSITAGISPRLISYHSVISCNSQTKLEDVMRCRNLVILQIGRIAALHEHKMQALRQRHFDLSELHQIGDDISREIQYGFDRGALEVIDLSEGNLEQRYNVISDERTLVTHIFAFMASIYLHLVIQGLGNLEVLERSISGAMEMVRNHTPPHILPAAVCPLFIIGSVAREEDKQFFRDIFSSAPLRNPVLQHRTRLLPFLEEIWMGRESRPDFAWADVLELTQDILLI
jgi:hypothetical protein